MTADEIQSWILVGSGAVSMISLSLGVWLALREYRLKLRADARAAESAELEAEIRLNTLLQDLMQKANGRTGYTLSERAVEHVLHEMASVPLLRVEESTATIDLKNLDALNNAIERLAIMSYPIGSAQQDSAVAAVYSLAVAYPRIRPTALAALEGLKWPTTSPLAAEYAAKLQALADSASGGQTARA